ncbi:MAG: hypothetical protein OCD01_09505 [Fibrobacterales bacterium]
MNKIFFVLILTFLTMCTDNSTSGTADTTSTGIALEGKVLTQNGVGVSNVMAKIANSNFSDLTDESGSYSITVSPDSLVTAGVDINTLSDTVQIIHENSLVKSLDIVDWQDTLPDVFLVQRSISGDLIGDLSSIVKIEAVLRNLTDTTAPPQVSALWINTKISSYNSFIYFKQEPVPTQYSIYIRVYTTEFTISGISTNIEFPSNAGDIVIPPFDVHNVKSDIINMNNVVVSISDTAHLSATITGNTSPIIKYEWDIGNMGNYVESPGPATTFVAPDSTRSIVYILKVTDADGGVFQNSSILTVIEDAPEVTITTTDSIASINDSLHFKAHATDFYGTVIKYEWDVGNTGVFIEGSIDDTFVGVSPNFLTDSFSTIIRVTDDDGITTTNFIKTKVIEDLPIAVITPTASSFPIKDSVELIGTLSSDSLGTIVSYEWKEGYGEWFMGKAIQTISTPQSIDTIFVVSLRVTDDDGNTALTSINLNLHGDTITDVRDGQRYAIETKDDFIWMAEDLKYSESSFVLGDTLGSGFTYNYKSGGFWYYTSHPIKVEYCPTDFYLAPGHLWDYPSRQPDAGWQNDYPSYHSVRCVTQQRIVNHSPTDLPDSASIYVVTNDFHRIDYYPEHRNQFDHTTEYWVYIPYLPNDAFILKIEWDITIDREAWGIYQVYNVIHEGPSIKIPHVPSDPPGFDLCTGYLDVDYTTHISIKVYDTQNNMWHKNISRSASLYSKYVCRPTN